MTKYGWIFILSQQKLASVSHFHPAIQTIVKKHNICSSTENLYYSENKQHKLRNLSELKENLKKYDYLINIIANGIKKTLGIP